MTNRDRDIIDYINETRREKILKILSPLVFVGMIMGLLLILENFL